jgi:hypothetical protein
MNDNGLEDMGLGGLMFLGIGLVAAATYGTYYLGRKAGFTGPQTILGMLVLGSVTSALRAKPAYVQPVVSPTPVAAPTPVRIARQLNDFELLDQLAGWGV